MVLHTFFTRIFFLFVFNVAEGLGLDNIWVTHCTTSEEVEKDNQIMVNGEFWRAFGEWIEVSS